MDLFREESVSKVNTGFNNLMYVLASISMILFGFLGIFFLSIIFGGNFHPINFINLALAGGVTAFSYFIRNNQRIEYDYTFTNGILDIAKVINNNKRKKLLSTDIRKFEIIAPISDDGFNRALSHPGIKKYNYFLNRGGGLYYGVFTDGSTRSILVFEPSDEMLEMFKKVNPRNVKQ